MIKVNIELTPALLAVLPEAILRQILNDMLNDDTDTSTSVKQAENSFKIENNGILPKEDLKQKYEDIARVVKNDVDKRIAAVKAELKESDLKSPTLVNDHNLKLQTLKHTIVPDEHLMSEIASKYNDGVSIAQLSRKYNVNLSTLYTKLYKSGLIVKKK